MKEKHAVQKIHFIYYFLKRSLKFPARARGFHTIPPFTIWDGIKSKKLKKIKKIKKARRRWDHASTR